ncbi:unnamed protein product [Hermetia illucens]|uniref:Protein sleepless n=1 Tax=Hermetia illucens TaxID=343691 RepID=A0A7R8UFM9_HERIL|nr:uncharacterized protein LOC119646226 [Hermetia illucens]CAD7079963.1 unnamed protein product [Hermetia illucens]
MVKYGLVLLAVLAVVSMHEVDALRCWRCSSDATGGNFCNDPFQGRDYTQNPSYQSALVECSYPVGGPSAFGPNAQPACKKTIQKVNDKTVVSRSCTWIDSNDTPKKCMTSPPNPSYVETLFCETCLTDECNGAAQYGPMAALILIPVAIARLLTA